MRRFNNGRTKVRAATMRVEIAGHRPLSAPPNNDPYFPVVVAPAPVSRPINGEPRLVGFSCTLHGDGNVASRPMFR